MKVRNIFILVGVVILVLGGLFVGWILVPEKTASYKDYGSNFEGFFANVERCEPSEVSYNITGFLDDTFTYKIVLSGIENERCLIHIDVREVGDTSSGFVRSLVKDCDVPTELVKSQFELFRLSSSDAFSDRTLCRYTDWVFSD